jgi:hypothetical protein
MWMTCWSAATEPQIRHGSPIQMWRHPLGQAHAFAPGALTAVCGSRREFDNGLDWPPSAARYELCAECTSLTDS